MSNASPRVALVKGDDRYANIRKALELIEGDIHLEGAAKILVKPNLISIARQLAITHIDALRALLDFLKERTSCQIIIGEGTGTGSPDTMTAFRRLGYFNLGERYNVRFVDLNIDEGEPVEILDSQLGPLTVMLAKSVVDADYRISLCPPKTHDCVIITLSLKNMLVGSLRRKENAVAAKLASLANLMPLRTSPSLWVGLAARWIRISGNDKVKIHQGYPAINLNLYKLARIIPPHLSLIDGFEAMEGEGPTEGEKVDLRIALASTDFVACDSIAARIMGFDIADIGYLRYCHQAGLGQGDILKINIIGESIEACARTFKPHPSFQRQLKWHI
ncbi:MAG: DUF362 domain-containing protein, partial [Dehalococcoidia bacterium]